MGHTLVPTGKIPGSRTTIDLDSLPDSIQEDVEDAVTYAENGNADMLSYQADGKAAGEENLRFMRAYARNREPRVVIYGNVTKTGVVKFRVTPYEA